MAEVSIALNGRSYDIDCDNGQEERIIDLAAYVDSKIQQIARAGGAWSEAHLLVLATLVLADEAFEEREHAATRPAAALKQTSVAKSAGFSTEDEQLLARSLSDLARRIEGIAKKVQAA